MPNPPPLAQPHTLSSPSQFIDAYNALFETKAFRNEEEEKALGTLRVQRG